jgi:hypothetical protein
MRTRRQHWAAELQERTKRQMAEGKWFLMAKAK